MDKPLAENAADSKTVDNKVLELAFFAEYPPGMIVPDAAEVPDFVEINTFKDIYAVDDEFEYAARLRRMRDFRNGIVRTKARFAIFQVRVTEPKNYCLFSASSI